MGPWLVLAALVLVLGSAAALAPRVGGRGPDHLDGTAHDFTDRTGPGEHHCEPGACRHWRETCACGMSRLAGFAVEDIR